MQNNNDKTSSTSTPSFRGEDNPKPNNTSIRIVPAKIKLDTKRDLYYYVPVEKSYAESICDYIKSFFFKPKSLTKEENLVSLDQLKNK